ncbi:S41 family peptidase, partial [Candidatus Peregrinibacteria bacterium]|nr:S41 family peptidase [Candidatus Peregrinibacteria bacterium]
MNPIKKILAGFLISLFIFNATAFAYDDIPGDSEYFYPIHYLRQNGVFPDKKLFRPDLVISKAEFIKYLVLLNNPDFTTNIKVNLPFEDTNNSAWYAPYFQDAIRLGVLSDREQKIDPYKKLTVFEALELLFHSRSIPIPRQWVGKSPYTDVEKNSNVKALVMRAVELGVVEPERQDYFGLYRRITRAKAAQMIYKMDLVDLRTTADSQRMVIQTFEPSLQKIVSIWEIINSSYVDLDNIETQKLSDEAIRGMVDALGDPYSAYMDQEQNSAFSDEFDGEIEGIGAFVGVDDDGFVTIVTPIKDSPAQKAGVRAGDVVLKVDDFDAQGATLYEVVDRIKGPRGTTVKLTLRRSMQTVVIEVKRDVIVIEPLEYEVVGQGDIMHIRLLNFNQNAPEKLQEVMDIISNNPKIKGVILDVRDNPGGLLDVAIGVLNFFLPPQSVASHIRYSYFNFTQYTSGKGQLQDYPVVVLINKGSASASEIVAGALKDHGKAILIGETSFGKGTVQEVNYFADTSSLKLTVAEWLTPHQNSIQGSGIVP